MKKKIMNSGFWFVFFGYLLLLLDIVFLSRWSVRGEIRALNLQPFASIRSYIHLNPEPYEKLIDVNIWGNLLLFLPLGIYVMVLFKQIAVRRGLLLVALSSLTIEVLQYLLGVGSGDIDDFFLNLLGGSLGIGIYLLVAKRFPSQVKEIISGLSLLIGLPILLLAVLLWLIN